MCCSRSLNLTIMALAQQLLSPSWLWIRPPSTMRFARVHGESKCRQRAFVVPGYEVPVIGQQSLDPHIWFPRWLCWRLAALFIDNIAQVIMTPLYGPFGIAKCVRRTIPRIKNCARSLLRGATTYDMHSHYNDDIERFRDKDLWHSAE